MSQRKLKEKARRNVRFLDMNKTIKVIPIQGHGNISIRLEKKELNDFWFVSAYHISHLVFIFVVG